MLLTSQETRLQHQQEANQTINISKSNCSTSYRLWLLMINIWSMIKDIKREKPTDQANGLIQIQSSSCQEKYKKKSRVTIWMQRLCARESLCKFLTFVQTQTLRVRFSQESSLKKPKLRKYSHHQAIHRCDLSHNTNNKISSNKKKQLSSLRKMLEITPV